MELCWSKVILSGVNGNVIMSGWKNDNPDDERCMFGADLQLPTFFVGNTIVASLARAIIAISEFPISHSTQSDRPPGPGARRSRRGCGAWELALLIPIRFQDEPNYGRVEAWEDHGGLTGEQ